MEAPGGAPQLYRISEKQLNLFGKTIGRAVHRLYRVQAEPTYHLIKPNGAIADKWIGGGQALERLTKALKRYAPHPR